MRNRERENVLVNRKDVLIGRVDLVRALTAGGVELQEALAGLLGFERELVAAPLGDLDRGPMPSSSPAPGTHDDDAFRRDPCSLLAVGRLQGKRPASRRRADRR